MNNKEKWEFDEFKHSQVEDVLEKNETILYRTKPKKSAYIWSAILPMFPIVVLWAVVDGVFFPMFIGAWSSTPFSTFLKVFTCLFFICHLAPVWLWLGNIIKSALEYKNIDYAFTDRRIIIRNGIIGIDFKSIFYTEIDSIDVEVGIIDTILKVGDIRIKHGIQHSIVYDVGHPYSIVTKLQKITLDIKADIHYPNDLRPNENHGYNTKYKG